MDLDEEIRSREEGEIGSESREKGDLLPLFPSCKLLNTRKSVSSDIQTLRSPLKKRGAAEFIF